MVLVDNNSIFAASYHQKSSYEKIITYELL